MLSVFKLLFFLSAVIAGVGISVAYQKFIASPSETIRRVTKEDEKNSTETLRRSISVLNRSLKRSNAVGTALGAALVVSGAMIGSSVYAANLKESPDQTFF